MSKRIAIDAGHGSNTAGKRTPDGYREHWMNVRMAYFFDIAAKRCGFETVKIAWDDGNGKDDENDIALSIRQKKIKDSKCDYSVSFHCNAFGNNWNSAKGIETFYHSTKMGDSKKLAKLVQEELINGTKQTNRGVKHDKFAMCNTSSMNTKASILIEAGFMTNKTEAELLKDDAFLEETAEETCKGFCKYCGMEYIDPEKKDEKFKIRIKVSELNIRKTPGDLSKDAIVGSIKDKLLYTIVETDGNWGKLKSGAGWINCSDKYVTKL